MEHFFHGGHKFASEMIVCALSILYLCLKHPQLNQTYTRSNHMTTQMGIGGESWRFSPAQSYWALADPQGGGAKTFRLPTGFKEDDELAKRQWERPETGVVHAFHV